MSRKRIAQKRLNFGLAEEAATLRMFERIRAVFDLALMKAKAGQGEPSDAPVFIIGMPRSGTTLVEQIPASHPMVLPGGELPHFFDQVSGLRGPDGAVFPEAAPFLTAADLHRLGAGYRAAVGMESPRFLRFTDKLPSNFLRAGLIALTFPNGRIIHIRRDPIDTCLSCFSKMFPDLPYTYDLAELGRYYREYERLMAHWQKVLPAGMMLEVSYEALVDDFEAQARRIIDHCNLPWVDACLDFHLARRPVATSSSAQVRQPLYRSSVARAQPYRPMLGPLLDALAG